jgi:hypothetical protein
METDTHTFTWSDWIGRTCAELERVSGVSWDIWNTGGNCQAYACELPNGVSVMLTDEASLPDWGRSTEIVLGIYSENETDWDDLDGEFVYFGSCAVGAAPVDFDAVIEFVGQQLREWEIIK